MTKTVLTGLGFSTYTRTVRMVLETKRVPYQFEEADLGSPEHRQLHPFNRIPVLAHGDLRIFEALAICTYVDRAFPGPALQPNSSVESAQMFQWISVVNDYIYESFVRQCILERFLKPMRQMEPDEEVIAAAKPTIKVGLAVFDNALRQKQYLTGDDMSLADFFLTPIIVYFQATPEGKELLPQVPHLIAWQERMAKISNFAEINNLP